MSILVSGSVAFDHVMVFPDRFAKHILPDKLHILNVSFNIESLQTHFGGVAGNIAFGLRLLGEDPVVLAVAGSDFAPYAEWLERHGIRRDGIRVLGDVRCAQGFVTTDLDDNQIWAFYEGALARAHEARVEELRGEFSLAIVSANSKRAMLEHARALRARGVPIFVDPSHALPLLERDELVELIESADAYVANDYEWAKTLTQSGLSGSEIERRCAAIVITKGEQGSEIRAEGRRIEIPGVRAERVVDPTGCGDAYRAGLLYGRARGLSWEVSGRLGSLIGACQVAVPGPQGLALGMPELRRRYEREFGASF